KSLGKLVRPKAWDIPNKILDIQIALDQLDISIMRPAMSVKAKVETFSLENCLAVPLKAVRTTAEGSMVKVKTDQESREQRGWRLGEGAVGRLRSSLRLTVSPHFFRPVAPSPRL